MVQKVERSQTPLSMHKSNLGKDGKHKKSWTELGRSFHFFKPHPHLRTQEHLTNLHYLLLDFDLITGPGDSKPMSAVHLKAYFLTLS